MTGPEHYRMAERMIGRAASDDLGSDSERYHLAKAQVHATLALAAAWSLANQGAMPIADSDAWLQVASLHAPIEADR